MKYILNQKSGLFVWSKYGIIFHCRYLDVNLYIILIYSNSKMTKNYSSGVNNNHVKLRVIHTYE